MSRFLGLALLGLSMFKMSFIVLGFSGSRFSILFTKSVVSLMKDFDFVVMGFRKISTKADIFSVAHPLPETIGLPGGDVVFCEF